MKSIITAFILLSIISCQPKVQTYLDVPWFVSEQINDDLISHYNYADSLKKYEEINSTTIENLGNYYSYLANLNFKTNPSKTKKSIDLLNKAFALDTVSFCEELILETHYYVKRNGRPVRNFTMPFIVELDMDYFLTKLEECQPFIQDKELVFDRKKEEFSLRMSYIHLKDQWFRIPSRKENPQKCLKYDTENHKELDRLYKTFPLSKENDDIREEIWTLILHSTDCDWAKKWLKIYCETYRGYKRYEPNLNWFLWRQEACVDQEIKDIINKEISQLKNK